MLEEERDFEGILEQSTIFVKDLEEIVDIVLNAEEIFFYDTGSIASHERIYHSSEKNLLRHYEKGQYPIIITDTILRELKLTQRNLEYLAQFSKLIYLREEDFFNLLNVEIETRQATGRFLNSSIKAFSDFIPLKESVSAVENISGADTEVILQFNSFFEEIDNKSKGEISLLWCSLIISNLSINGRMNFISKDSDLYSFVNRCYAPNPYLISNKPKPRITLMSNEVLIQGIHNSETIPYEEFCEYLNLYRDDVHRGVIYFNKQNNVMDYNSVVKKSFTNDELRDHIVSNQIKIIY
ncbi:hypothetical protein P4573_14270 [Priestia megaterium]|uniref:hypothetical protein n=1 Tax=Priestia megaterium TaxID=1404 RepID=UPI002E1E48FB|nr:hypothetical protein [Priestia megaterium]